MRILKQYILVIFLLAFIPLCRSMAECPSRLKVAILGDSNTSIGGDDCAKPQGWTKWFVEKFAPLSCRSFARSGATWTNTANTRRNVKEDTDLLSDDNVVFNQVCRLFEACDSDAQAVPDLVIIAAGTNDAWFYAKRPGLFGKTASQAFSSAKGFIVGRKPSTVCSLAESVRYVCEMLIERLPNTQIILLTPMQTIKAPYERTQKVGNIIEECAHRMSIPVVRQDYCNGVYDVRERTKHIRTTDGTHTSIEGAKRNGYLIANQIAALLVY